MWGPIDTWPVPKQWTFEQESENGIQVNWTDREIVRTLAGHVGQSDPGLIEDEGWPLKPFPNSPDPEVFSLVRSLSSMIRQKHTGPCGISRNEKWQSHGGL